MKRFFWSQDMSLLKWPVLLLVICVLASAVWCGSAFRFRERAALATRAAQANREQMAESVRKIEEEAATIRSHMDQYRDLQTRGIIGDEERLQVVEAVGRFRIRHRLYPIHFDMAQQVVIPLQADEPEDVGPWLSLRSSQIRITLSLLHEEDLTHLLDDLRNVGRGIFVVEECTVDRPQGEVGGVLKMSENLTAACTLLWLTLKSEEKKPGEALTVSPPES